MATNVLIVEDDDAVAQALRDVLETEGYTVWRAGTGAEADAIQRERHHQGFTGHGTQSDGQRG